MKQEMLINVAQPEECRIAIVEDGVLEELYVERSSQDNYVGNIYKGQDRQPRAEHPGGVRRFWRRPQRLPAHQRRRAPIFPPGGIRFPTNPIPSGGGRANKSSTKREGDDEETDARGSQHSNGNGNDNGNARRSSTLRPGARPRVKPPIQEIFRRGDEVLVQVIKEGIGSKGPTLSTYISIPGRYLVLMPALGRVGVSRKIEDEDARNRLRDILYEHQSAQGPGVHRSHSRH